MVFDDKDTQITLKPTGNVSEKIALLKNLYDKAAEKTNHFDKLRQQNLNYALLVFSGLLAFIINNRDVLMQCLACIGIVVIMVIFSILDDRLHKFTHGFAGSMYVFTKVTAHLIDNPSEEVSFQQYYFPGEDRAGKCSVQKRIYMSLALASVVLGAIVLIRHFR